MRAHGSIVVTATDGRSHLRTARSDPPFAVRTCGDRILIAASAAAPVGGDDLSFEIDVGSGARADVGTVASTMVLPGPSGTASTMTTRCTVRSGGHLDWAAEPTVSVRGSDHTLTTTVDLAETATCRIVEEVVLGRCDEPSGRLTLALRVRREGRPLLHHDELFGPDVPGAGSLVSVGDARHVLSAVLVGVDAGDARIAVSDLTRVAWLPIAADAAVVLAIGPDRLAVGATVRDVTPETAVLHSSSSQRSGIDEIAMV